MDVLWWILAGAAVLIGLAGMVLPLLPGTPLVFGGLWLAAWLDDYTKVGVGVVVLLGVLAVLAWAVDYVAATMGVKRMGASNQAMVGAGVGTVLGLFGGLPGLVLGPIVGAVGGEWLARRDPRQAARAGLGAGVGFLLATVAKLGLGIAMIACFAFAYFIG